MGLGVVSEAHIYRDFGISGYLGSIYDRPQVKRLRHAVSQGLIKAVVFKGISRFARDTQDALDLLSRFKSQGLRVLSYEESYDSNKPDSDFMFTVQAALAEQESVKTSLKVRMGKKQRAKDGKWNGPPPYGYLVEKSTGKLVPHPEESIVVKKIFELCTKHNYGALRISRHLSSQGILYRNSNNWSSKNVLGMLKNEVYLGRILYNKTSITTYRDYSNSENGQKKSKRVKNDKKSWTIIDDCHPAIIDKETFEEARRLLAQRKDAIPYIKPRYAKHLLSSIIKCPNCGSSYIVLKRKERKTNRVYVCSLKHKQGASYCDSARIPADELENYVLDVVRKDLKSIVSREALSKLIVGVDTPTGELEAKLEIITMKLQKLNEDMYDLFQNRDQLTPNQYEFMQSKIKEDTERLEKEHAQVGGELDNIGNTDYLVDSVWGKIEEFISLKVTDTMRLRSILETLIEKIHVLPGNHVKIYYKFKI